MGDTPNPGAAVLDRLAAATNSRDLDWQAFPDLPNTDLPSALKQLLA
jgi:hypothetical protein